MEEKGYGMRALCKSMSEWHNQHPEDFKRRGEYPVERISDGYQAFCPISELRKDLADHLELS